MKKILVPTDFSELSSHALNFAYDIAKFSGAQIELIHFIDLPLDAELLVSGDTQLVETSEDTLYNLQLVRANNEKLKKSIEHLGNEVKIHTGLGSSGFLRGTQKYAKKFECDLVIIATTGEESAQEFFSGNHTEQLIEHLNIPVISLKEHVEFDSLTDITLAIDLLGEKYPGASLPMIKAVAESFDAKVHVVNVVKPGEASLKKIHDGLDEFAQAAKLSNYEISVVEYKDDMEGLLYYAEKIDAGLIAIISDARSGIFRFFQDSFATELTKKSDIPVMVLNKRNLK